MPDYSKGKIYKLWSPSKNLVYYGSTVQTLAQRLTKHKNHYKTYKNDDVNKYCSSYLVLDCEDYKIELMEEYPCNNKSQLDKKEGEYQKNNECVNIRLEGRTKKEYSKEYKIKNKEQIKEYNKQYNENNKEQTKEYIKEYRIKNKEKRKEYLEANKDKIKEQNKIRNKKYREKLKQNNNNM